MYFTYLSQMTYYILFIIEKHIFVVFACVFSQVLDDCLELINNKILNFSIHIINFGLLLVRLHSCHFYVIT